MSHPKSRGMGPVRRTRRLHLAGASCLQTGLHTGAQASYPVPYLYEYFRAEIAR